MTRQKRKRVPRDTPPPSAAVPTATTWIARHGAWFAVLFVFVFVAAVRLRLAGVALERDEGEYAYAGQLILQGIPPYLLAYNMKFPGTYYAYSLIMAAFGQTPWGIHVGLLVVNAATLLLVFLIGRRLLGDFAGAIGAAAFGLLSLDRWIMGVFAHATHFVLLPALAALFLLLRIGNSRAWATLAGAGALLGIAVLMKQHAVLFVPLAFGLWVWHQRGSAPRDLKATLLGGGALVAGMALPFFVIGGLFAAQGVLGRFWFWTIQYAKEYVSEVPLSDAWTMLSEGWQAVTQANLPIWMLAAAGLPALWIGRWTREARVLLTGLLAASFLAVCPGFYFREHYFILLLPAAGLFVAVAVAALARALERISSRTAAQAMAAVVFAAFAVTYIVQERAYLFSMPMRDLSKTRYGPNPFVEAGEIATYIREKTDPADRIAVMGSEPEIYFYANRKSATGYIYTYPLMEPQPYASRMQEEMIHEVGGAHPKYIVFVGVSTSWLSRPGSDLKIINWIEQYTGACYDLAGVAELRSIDETVWRWDSDAAGREPRSQNVVYTFVRRSAAPCSADRQ